MGSIRAREARRANSARDVAKAAAAKAGRAERVRVRFGGGFHFKAIPWELEGASQPAEVLSNAVAAGRIEALEHRTLKRYIPQIDIIDCVNLRLAGHLYS